MRYLFSIIIVPALILCAAGQLPCQKHMTFDNYTPTQTGIQTQHPNERVIREMFAAYGRGDMAALRTLFAEDVVYHIPGRNMFSKDYRGQDAIFALFEQQKKRMGGRPYKVEILDMLVSDKHVVALTRVEAQAEGKSATWRSSNVYAVRNGKIAEAWFMLDDLYAYDQFWTPRQLK